MIRKKLIVKIVFIGIILILAKYFLFNYSYVPEKSEFQVDFEHIRNLCGEGPDLPSEINTIITAEGKLMSWTIAAGEKDIPNKYIQTSFQIIYDDRSILIDAPLNKKPSQEFGYRKHHIKKNETLQQKAIQDASLILFTHEHADHMGGLAGSKQSKSLTDKVLITKNQVQSRKIKKLNFNKKLLFDSEILDYKNCFMITPGIVLIEAPGHTKGNQMIYIKLQNGNEYLLVGDIVWNFANIEKPANRPFLATILGGENIIKLGHQIRWLHDLNENEDIFIIPSHDPEIIKMYQSKKLLGTIN